MAVVTHANKANSPRLPVPQLVPTTHPPRDMGGEARKQRAGGAAHISMLARTQRAWLAYPQELTHWLDMQASSVPLRPSAKYLDERILLQLVTDEEDAGGEFMGLALEAYSRDARLRTRELEQAAMEGASCRLTERAHALLGAATDMGDLGTMAAAKQLLLQAQNSEAVTVATVAALAETVETSLRCLRLYLSADSAAVA